MQTTSYKLNVTPGGVPLTIHISQYDVGLRQYTFQPYTTVGEFSYVSGATVTLEATKPDGYAVIHECDYNQDGSITYTVQAQLAAKPGRVWSKVVIRDGSDVLGTGAVVWIVDNAGVKDNAIISDSDISALQQWMDDVEDYAEQADGSAQSAASSASLAESAVTSAQAAATQAAGYVDQAVILGGTPLVAATVSAMSDHDRVYVYTGSETGYTAGNWYYWNGSAWTSGGIYNSSAVQTDPTLSVSGMAADAAATGELKTDIDGISENFFPVIRNGSLNNLSNAYGVSTTYIIDYAGANYLTIKINRPVSDPAYVYAVQYSTYSITSGETISSGSYRIDYDILVDIDGTALVLECDPKVSGSKGIGLTLFEHNPQTSEWFPLRITDFGYGDFSVIKTYTKDVATPTSIPTLRDGTLSNKGNAYAVSMLRTVESKSGDRLKITYTGDLNTGYEIAFQLKLYNGGIGVDPDNNGSHLIFTEELVLPETNIRTLDISKYLISYPSTVCFGVAIYMRDASGTYIPLRVANVGNCLSIEKIASDSTYDLVRTKNTEEYHKSDAARHIPGSAGTPLTLLHFSDIHGQEATLSRITYYASNYGNGIDDIICTGDINNASGGEISSWWNPKVLTCIGNHDSCTIIDNVYYWTAISMADRDAYYIAPFESNWGITHTSGTSYYYKDYTTQKVRLIVMDAMLYSDNGAEATAQTTWLTNLLSDAITNSYHVLIAIHSPHGGATPVECSFSKYGQGTMPTYTDCNTPQAVIDAVATKISAGLKFIGYITGHTHQDNVWDSESDGKQLMYNVTCASTSEGLWTNADLSRVNNTDAFNIITIDTTNTLIKIVRGGGADIDDHMRTRKAICFNYSTGQKVGEVL